MKKRIISILLVIIFCIGLLPAAALAEEPEVIEEPAPIEDTAPVEEPAPVEEAAPVEEDEDGEAMSVMDAEIINSGNCGANGDNVTWTLDSDGVLTISGEGEMANFDDHNNKAPWYSQRSNICSVVIQNKVTSIGDLAFYYYSCLSSISIGERVSRIGRSSFSNCTSLTNITIPDSVTIIGDFAFHGCSNLTTIAIGSSVNSIGWQAFLQCIKLTNVILPDSLKIIGDEAFYGCSSITDIIIPTGVTTIGFCAFYDCINLHSITIPDSVTHIGYLAFRGCSGLTSVTIPDSVTIIEHSTFACCSNLISITIPDSVTSIEYAAFNSCTNLTNVIIPNSDIDIEDGVFEECSSLACFTIPDGITRIGYYVFSGCTSLTSVTIPDSVVTIGYHAFYGCNRLSDVYYEGTAEQWEQISFGSTNGFLTNARIHFNSLGKPTIDTQPINLTTSVGSEVLLKVTASGYNLTYQWQYSKDGGITWTNCSGTAATFTFKAKVNYNGWQYRCVVTNGAGDTTSNAAILTVLSKLKITTQPMSLTVNSGDTVTFTVAASDADSYQWQYSKDGGSTWLNCSGTDATFRFTAKTGYSGWKYRCVVTNADGATASNAATLTVNSKPVIVVQPATIAVSADSTAVFALVATGATGYQWQYSKNGGTTWINCSGKSAVFSFTAKATLDGRLYRCLVTNAYGRTASAVVTLIVISTPIISTQPADQTVAAGEQANFKVVATGAASYQWQYSKDGGSTWANCSGKAATFSFTAAAKYNGWKYRCVVTNANGSTVSNAVVLTVV